MSAAALQVNFERLAVNNAGNIEKKRAIEKAKGKAANKAAVDDALGLGSKVQSRGRSAAPPAATERQVKAFASKMDEAVKAKDMEKRETQRIEKYRRVIKYFELAPDMCIGLKKPSLTASEQELDTLLAEIHGRFGGQGAKLVIDMALVSVFRGIEMACTQYGFDQMLELETKGLGARMMMMMRDPQFMQPERTEIYIENASRFEQPYWVRAMFKVGQSVVAYSEGQKAARLNVHLQQPVSEEARKQYADI